MTKARKASSEEEIEGQTKTIKAAQKVMSLMSFVMLLRDVLLKEHD